MTLDKLNYLITLAEEKNVTKAAKRLFITQPTLTAFINKLEESLNFKIFDRTKVPVLLTPNGKIYIEEMQKILAAEIKLTSRLRQVEHNRKEIRIGIGQIHSQLWIPDLIASASIICPSVNFTIKEGPELQLKEWLHNDELDLFLGHLGINTIEDTFEDLCEEKLMIIIPENLMPLTELDEHALSNNSPEHPIQITREYLENMPVIEPDSFQGLYLNFKTLMQQYDIHPTQIIKTSNTITGASMVLHGLGYMYTCPVIFDHANVKNPLKLYYCYIEKMQTFRNYYAIYKDNNSNIEIIRELIKIMRTIV